MRLLTTLVLSFGFVGSAMATSLPEVGNIVSATCTSGTLDRAAVIKALEIRAEKYVTVTTARMLVYDRQTRLVKSGYGFIENAEALMIVLPSTAENPYCKTKQLIPATKDQPASEAVVPVGTVIIKIDKR